MSLPRTLKGIKERVKIVGDTMTGNLEISKTNSPIVKITDSSQGRRGEFMYNINEEVLISNYKDENSRTLLFLRNEDNTTNLLQVSKVKDGQWSSYNLYGEHNKPSAKDVGALPVNGEKYRVDLNTVLEQGSYMFYYEEGDQATYHTPTNYISWINLLVIGMGTRITQIATLPYAHERNIYVRYKHDSNWTEWDKIYTTRHKPTPEELNAIKLDNRMNDSAYSHNVLGIIDAQGNPMLQLKKDNDTVLLKYNVANKRFQMDESNDGGSSWHQVKVHGFVLTDNLRIKHDNYKYYTALCDYEQSTELRSSKTDGSNTYSALILYNDLNWGGTRLTYRQVIDGTSKDYTVYSQFNKPTPEEIGALSLTTGGTLYGGMFIRAGYGGPEGGQFSISKPENTHLFDHDITVDVYTNAFRVFSSHSGVIKVFNLDFTTINSGDATIYHTQNIRNGSGSTPGDLPNQGIYIKY